MSIDFSQTTLNEAMDEIADSIKGTCDSEDKWVEILEDWGFYVDSDDIVDYLLDRNIERCSGCGWWHESHELVNEDNDIVGCEQCRKFE